MLYKCYTNVLLCFPGGRVIGYVRSIRYAKYVTPVLTVMVKLLFAMRITHETIVTELAVRSKCSKLISQ